MADYIELQKALYGPEGLYPEVRMADVPRVLGRVVWRKGRGARFCKRYVKLEMVERVRRQIEQASRDLAELVG